MAELDIDVSGGLMEVGIMSGKWRVLQQDIYWQGCGSGCLFSGFILFGDTLDAAQITVVSWLSESSSVSKSCMHTLRIGCFVRCLISMILSRLKIRNPCQTVTMTSYGEGGVCIVVCTIYRLGDFIAGISHWIFCCKLRLEHTLFGC